MDAKSVMYDFVKMMYDSGVDVKAYVILQFITKDEYKDITGTDYVRPVI